MTLRSRCSFIEKVQRKHLSAPGRPRTRLNQMIWKKFAFDTNQFLPSKHLVGGVMFTNLHSRKLSIFRGVWNECNSIIQLNSHSYEFFSKRQQCQWGNLNLWMKILKLFDTSNFDNSNRGFISLNIYSKAQSFLTFERAKSNFHRNEAIEAFIEIRGRKKTKVWEQWKNGKEGEQKNSRE